MKFVLCAEGGFSFFKRDVRFWKKNLFDATCAFSNAFFFEIINEKRREKRINDHHGSPRRGAEKRKTKKTKTTVRERDFRLLLRFRLRVVLVHERDGKFAKGFQRARVCGLCEGSAK